jgi:hypothetical protein
VNKLLMFPAVATLALATTPAHAAAPRTEAHRAAYVHVAPNPAVLYPDRSTWVTIRANLDTNRPIYGGVLAEMRPASGDGYNYTQLFDPDGDGVWVGKVKFSDSEAGALGVWRVETSAIAEDTAETLQGPTGSFVLRGLTRTTAKFKPGTVRKGGVVKASGTVKAFTSYGYFTGSANRVVRLYFRKAGTKKWVYAAKAKTDSYGVYRKGVRPTRSGWWVARFPGAGNQLASASKPVFVKVR